MSHTNRTNPAYAYMAYRRAILQHVSAMLLREYHAPVGSEANRQIYSDEVYRCDAQVPIADVGRYIEELQAEDAKLALEMNKFEFRAQEHPIQIPAVSTMCLPAPQKANQNDQSKGTPNTGVPAASAAKPRKAN